MLKQAKTLVKARLENFRIEMKSVLYDLPIGIITLAQTQVTFESHEKIEQQNNVNVVAEVGDLRIETRPSEKVCGSYYVILGLAPNQTKSLLTVYYYKGEAVENAEIDEFDKKKCDACALVDISPMRFVYIQAPDTYRISNVWNSRHTVECLSCVALEKSIGILSPLHSSFSCTVTRLII